MFYNTPMTDKDSNKLSKHKGSDNTCPYPVSRLSAHMPLVELAREISLANDIINTRVSGQLKVIAEQIRHLQNEAHKVLKHGKRDLDLHHAECHFKRLPGKTYYLYKKINEQRYFSMLSPEEWGGKPPHEFIAAYKLEADMAWSSVDDIGKPDETKKLLDQFLEKYDLEF